MHARGINDNTGSGPLVISLQMGVRQAVRTQSFAATLGKATIPLGILSCCADKSMQHLQGLIQSLARIGSFFLSMRSINLKCNDGVLIVVAMKLDLF